MKYLARVCIAGPGVRPEWGPVVQSRLQKTEWSLTRGVRLMTPEYLGVVKVLDEWITWYTERHPTSAQIVKFWSERR